MEAEMQVLRDELEASQKSNEKLKKKLQFVSDAAEDTDKELQTYIDKCKMLETALKRVKAEEKVRVLQREAQQQLPLNRDLMACNVIEGDVPLEAVNEALRLYKDHVEPHLEPEREESQARWSSPSDVGENLNFFCLSPSEKKWKYHIDWVYPEDWKTRTVMESLFRGLKVREWFKEGGSEGPEGMGIDVEKEVTMYAASFVIRTGAKDVPFWHTDYEWFFGDEAQDNTERRKPAKQAYTLMTPLESMDSFADGHLLYKDIAGNDQVYRYKHGKAVCFGSGFEHATQPSTDNVTKAFLCFTFGTDKFDTYWKPYLEPPKAPPLGSKEFTSIVYRHLGIPSDSDTGYEAQ